MRQNVQHHLQTVISLGTFTLRENGDGAAALRCCQVTDICYNRLGEPISVAFCAYFLFIDLFHEPNLHL